MKNLLSSIVFLFFMAVIVSCDKLPDAGSVNDLPEMYK